ncbi:carbohydrate binding domain-containing protein [Actinoplanes sp. NPDC020271]|uniref:carbohydrate binding domain-containing protein n=1 Tax=Actinoplanes sp. NPDC020271 TaxID=3363896 RepID=UPI0037BDAEB5
MSSDRIRAVALSCLLTVGVLAPAAPALADDLPADPPVAAEPAPGELPAEPLPAEPLPAEPLPADPLPADPPVVDEPAPASGVAPTLAGRLAAVAGSKTMNYYPSGAGWSAMWTRFDAEQIDSDLARISALGADGVRIVVFPRVFGFPTPKPEYLDRLAAFVDIAARHDLAVKLTLFDWWSYYKLVRGSVDWAKAVIGPYADDPRVIAVEVKNEMSPEDVPAVRWARQIIPAIRDFAPTMPLTVSVDGHAGPDGLAELRDAFGDVTLDYYDYHFYGESEQALPDIVRARDSVAPEVMVIGETGLSTGVGSPGEQAAYLARVFRAAAVAGVRSVAPWTLTDFAQGAIPAGSMVSVTPSQYQFGLYRLDGTAKPAAAVVRNAWAATESYEDVLDLSFEQDNRDSPWRDNLPAAGVAEQTDEVAHDGRYSVRFSGTGRDPRGLPSLRISPVTPVRGGQSWSASAWARGENATGTTEITLSWFDERGRWIKQDKSARLPRGTTDWRQLTVTAVAPDDAAGVQLHLKSGDNAGSVWFDDVSLS